MNHRPHTAWCAKDHSCGLVEHRSIPYRATHPGLGNITMVRVQSADGRQHAELRISVPLASVERVARRQLETVLTELFHLLRFFRHIGNRAA
jgi:hypothetical protein